MSAKSANLLTLEFIGWVSVVDFHAQDIDKWWNTKNIFCWHGFLHRLAPCLPGLLACRSGKGGKNAVAILDWMMKMLFFVIGIGLGPLELTRACFFLVINVVVLHGPGRGRGPGSQQ